MEPEGSIPNSQELSTCSYPEPDQSSPHHAIPPLQDPSVCLSTVSEISDGEQTFEIYEYVYYLLGGHAVA
jgi:hypothetical protein